MNLSFAGCGFMGVYHLGVASCLQTYAPHILLNKVGISGDLVIILIIRFLGPLLGLVLL